MKYGKRLTIAVILVIVFVLGTIGVYVSKNKSLSIINTASASVTIVSPVDKEEWKVGTKQTIKWGSLNLPEKASVVIQLANPNLDEDGVWFSITEVPASYEEYIWEVPRTIKNGEYRIYLYAHGTGERINIAHDDKVISIYGSTAILPRINKITPSYGSLPSDVVTEIVNKDEVKEIVISGSGFNTKRIDDFTKNDIYFSSGRAFALFRNESSDGRTLTIRLPDRLGAGKVTEEVVPGIYEIFVKTASGKSNSVYITLTPKPAAPSYPQGEEIFPSGQVPSVLTPSMPIR